MFWHMYVYFKYFMSQYVFITLDWYDVVLDQKWIFSYLCQLSNVEIKLEIKFVFFRDFNIKKHLQVRYTCTTDATAEVV